MFGSSRFGNAFGGLQLVIAHTAGGRRAGVRFYATQTRPPSPHTHTYTHTRERPDRPIVNHAGVEEEDHGRRQRRRRGLVRHPG